MNSVLGVLMGCLIVCCLTGAYAAALLFVKRYATHPGWLGDLCPALALLIGFIIAWSSVVGVVYTFTLIAPQIFN